MSLEAAPIIICQVHSTTVFFWFDRQAKSSSDEINFTSVLHHASNKRAKNSISFNACTTEAYSISQIKLSYFFTSYFLCVPDFEWNFRKRTASARLTGANPSNQRGITQTISEGIKRRNRTCISTHNHETLGSFLVIIEWKICPTERGTENGNRPASLKSQIKHRQQQSSF